MDKHHDSETDLSADDKKRLVRAQVTARKLEENIETVVIGKQREIKFVLTALAAQGHVLLEDVPGTAKTVLARAIAGSIHGAETNRVQCTPDLQPTDVTGLSIYDPKHKSFEFRPGPVFANVVLIDEINRAMPKTQSALLEAMAEQQVTVDGETRKLPHPFLVLATENPIEQAGTFPLPEAQLDRFFIRTALGYPSPENELKIVKEQRHGHPLGKMRPAVSVAEIEDMQHAVEDVYIDEVLQRWIVDLVTATRASSLLEAGASVRGTLALERGARAWALLSGRDHVHTHDIEELFVAIVAHRVLYRPAALIESDPAAALFAECLAAAPRPTVREQ